MTRYLLVRVIGVIPTLIGISSLVFAINYLTRYAADQPERLRTLTPYFHAVLCQVNRGGLTRRRVHDFLRAEARKDRAAAEIVAEILGRHSATMAIMVA